MKIKICGINNLDFALAAAKYKVDFLGFIFYDKSPRVVNFEQAATIIHGLRQKKFDGKFVGVFIDTPSAEIQIIGKALGLSVIQLHGQYDVQDIEFLAQDFDIWFATSKMPSTEILSSSISAILVDSANPGNGQKSNWDIAKELINRNINTILAGGIGETNISEAIELKPWLLDINSKLEESKGVKSIAKLHSFYNHFQELNND